MSRRGSGLAAACQVPQRGCTRWQRATWYSALICDDGTQMSVTLCAKASQASQASQASPAAEAAHAEGCLRLQQLPTCKQAASSHHASPPTPRAGAPQALLTCRCGLIQM